MGRGRAAATRLLSLAWRRNTNTDIACLEELLELAVKIDSKVRGCVQCVDVFARVITVLVEALLGPVIAGVNAVVVGHVEAIVVRELPPDHRLLQECIHIFLWQAANSCDKLIGT